jgi:hypothetical protein
MEIYRNNLATIQLKVPVTAIAGTFEVNATQGSTVLYSFPTVTSITGGYQVSLPFSLVDEDMIFDINWSFNYLENSVTKSYKYTTNIEVVTPYLTKDEIIQAIPEAVSMSDYDLVRLEMRVRGIIDSYTGQSFGKFTGELPVIGAGDTELRLPNRLIKIDNISGKSIIESSEGMADMSFYALRGDGWYLGRSVPSPYGGDYVFEDVIRSPYSDYYCNEFTDNAVYTVRGIWGYEDVPADVKEAALIMCEDFICPQSEYRDRYLKTISGDGWRYEFDPDAYYGTGSVTADKLLDQFRRMTMTVI